MNKKSIKLIKLSVVSLSLLAILIACNNKYSYTEFTLNAIAACIGVVTGFAGMYIAARN